MKQRRLILEGGGAFQELNLDCCDDYSATRTR